MGKVFWSKEAIEDLISKTLSSELSKLRVLKSDIDKLRTELDQLNDTISAVNNLELQCDVHPYVLGLHNEHLRLLYVRASQDAQHRLMRECGPAKHFRQIFWMPNLETNGKTQSLCCPRYRGLVIVGLRNKGCKGKYRIQVRDRRVMDIHASRKDSVIVFPMPYIIVNEEYFAIDAIEGTTPNFELLGEQLVPS